MINVVGAPFPLAGRAGGWVAVFTHLLIRARYINCGWEASIPSPRKPVRFKHLFDFLLDRAETTEKLDRAQAVIEAIRAMALHQLATTPDSFRKPAQHLAAT